MANYRLQKVLDVRQHAQREMSAALQARREQLALAEAELERRRQAVAECRERQRAGGETMNARAAQGGRAGELTGYRTYLADLRQSEQALLAEVEQQRAVVARARSEVEKAVQALLDASKEVKVIERHRETWNERVRREEQRRDQKSNDEIGAVAHERRKP